MASNCDDNLLANMNFVPSVGMEFDTMDDAYDFYLAYSRKKGFGIRMS